ncbi:MAG: peptidase, partial [Verrucomicrobia bacterium]|nr:peptidase [Verrucomicrobiota bacterium]
LMKAGAEAYWLKDAPAGEPALGRGTLFVPNRGEARALVERAAAELGLDVRPVATVPAGDKLKLAPTRIALWDRYGGSMPSGWTRWVLEQFEFPFEVIYAPQIDAGDLRKKYDVILFVSGSIPAPGFRGSALARPRNFPPEYENRLGRITADKSIPQLKAFLEAGGTVVTLGTSTNLAYQLALPVQNALLEPATEGKPRPLSDDKFYVPGSILTTAVDDTAPAAWGLTASTDVYFERSHVFRLPPTATGLKPLAWFPNDKPLKSGWAWGQKYLKDGVVAAQATVGTGTLYLYGGEMAFRGQTHGTFKLVFNALYLATAK